MTTVIVSGHFDPLHDGHLELFKRARALGDRVVVILNNEHQTRQKKGYIFQPVEVRAAILRTLRTVDHVTVAADMDATITETLRGMGDVRCHTIYANGGDAHSIPASEREVCDRYGIEIVFGLGEKVRSSSELVGAGRSS